MSYPSRGVTAPALPTFGTYPSWLPANDSLSNTDIRGGLRRDTVRHAGHQRPVYRCWRLTVLVFDRLDRQHGAANSRLRPPPTPTPHTPTRLTTSPAPRNRRASTTLVLPTARTSSATAPPALRPGPPSTTPVRRIRCRSDVPQRSGARLCQGLRRSRGLPGHQPVALRHAERVPEPDGPAVHQRRPLPELCPVERRGGVHQVPRCGNRTGGRWLAPD